MGRHVINRLDWETIMRKHRIDPETNCWLWTGWCQSLGYGQVEINGKPWLVHRLAWYLWHDRTKPGPLLMHSCDVRNCFNPEHLKEGTHKENFEDAVRKGRHLGDIPLAGKRKKRVRKLTDAAVRDIRAGRLRTEDYCKLYKCGRTTVVDIRARRTKTLVPD